MSFSRNVLSLNYSIQIKMKTEENAREKMSEKSRQQKKVALMFASSGIYGIKMRFENDSSKRSPNAKVTAWWVNICQDTPRWAKMSQEDAKMTPRRAKMTPRWRQDDAKMTPRWAKMPCVLTLSPGIKPWHWALALSLGTEIDLPKIGWHRQRKAQR